MKVSNETRINLALTGLGLVLLQPYIMNPQVLQQPHSSLQKPQEALSTVHEQIRSPHVSAVPKR